MAQVPANTQPTAFISHGSPMLALDNGPWHLAMKDWASGLSGVRAVLVASAHWETSGTFHVTASPKPGVIHDFSGFPEALYRLGYEAPGDPALSAEIVAKLKAAGLKASADDQRPLDHGAWVPLRALFPEARLPIVQVSLPHPRDPGLLVEAGRALAPLRAEGILILGSGGLVHNLGRLDWGSHPTPEAWATTFEQWMMSGIEQKDVERLVRASQQAPGFAQAAPTPEHLDPIYVTLGAAGKDTPSTIYDGWQHGNLSLRAVAWS